MFHMNAMFVPDSCREEVTWLGSIGIIVPNSEYKTSNATYLRFETKDKNIYVGDRVTLLAKNIEKLSFSNGKMTISEAPPFESFRYPSVLVDLQDVGLNFTTGVGSGGARGAAAPLNAGRRGLCPPTNWCQWVSETRCEIKQPAVVHSGMA